MSEPLKDTPQALMNAFLQFKKIHWHHRPVNGLNPGDLGVMICILENSTSDEKGMKVSEISRFLRVKSPSVTQIINALNKQGLIERRVDSDDRRVVRIKLTPKGEETVKAAQKSLCGVFDELVHFLGEEDSQALTELMHQVFLFFSQKGKKW